MNPSMIDFRMHGPVMFDAGDDVALQGCVAHVSGGSCSLLFHPYQALKPSLPPPSILLHCHETTHQTASHLHRSF